MSRPVSGPVTRQPRAFWILAVVVWPATGFAVALPFAGSRSDEASLPVALGLPAALTLVTGWWMRLSVRKYVAAAVLSSAVAVVFVLIFLWYLFEVVGVR